MAARGLGRVLVAVVVAASVVVATGVTAGTEGPDQPGQAESTLTPKASPGLREIATLLDARERRLDRREAAIAQREADLIGVQGELDTRLGELKTLRDELRALLADMDQDTADRVDALVGMVSAMKAKDAAALITNLDADLAVLVLDRLSRGKAGKALAAMSSAKAAALAARMTTPIEVPG